MSAEIFKLSGGGTLEYVSSGDTKSSKVILGFPGLFAVASAPPPFDSKMLELGISYIQVTPPGQGESTKPPNAGTFATWLPGAIAELLTALGKDEETLRLIVSGGSYGTVHAQVIFGAPKSSFKFVDNLRGCVLLGPFSPPKYDKTFDSGLTFANWLSVGWPGKYLPILRIASWAMSGQVATPEKGEQFMKKTIFASMDDAEKAKYAAWRAKYGKEEGELEASMGKNASAAYAKSWQGFLEVNDEVQADWGFDPKDTAGRGKVFVVYGKADDRAPNEMAVWLVANYPDAEAIILGGGHLSALWDMEEVMLKAIDHSGLLA